MQHDNTLNRQIKIDQLPNKLKRIEDVKLSISAKLLRAEGRLQKLKGKYPRMLARKALKQSTSGEVLAMKREIMELEDHLEDFPLTLKGLEELEKLIHNEILEDQNEVESILFEAIINV